MADSLGSESVSIPDLSTSIRQTVDHNQGQAIGKMVGGFAVGQLTVYLSQVPTTATPESAPPSVEIGKNPYQGLLTFRETDGDRFFGRSIQIEQLWQRFQQLHGDRSTIRVLPIYGPSGSGKSSLARAGLIPELGKKPLPGCDRARVVVLTPGNHPVEALATVLARITTPDGDSMPVRKIREFQEELLRPNSEKEFDGLRRIANVFPDINYSPLIILVDQFEEIYTLCTDETKRHAFVENLLCAASDRAQRVSIILTLRSDFLGATQQHPQLNKLFSSQGFLVPIMQPEELAIAITEPAKRAGYTLDKATVQWLIGETEGRESSLPLLQFALTQIWEGLRNGVEPADTLEQIGGVGGALASEAKRLYYSLTPEQQSVARCIFLSLVQINEDNKSTRRRAAISELITGDSSEALVREVIDRFARPGVWILVTSCNAQKIEILEVAHEALIRNWQELQEWLKEHWETLRQKRKIEEAAIEWRDRKKSKDYLWRGRSLCDAKDFLKAHKDNSETALSGLAAEFINVSQERRHQGFLKAILFFLIFPMIGTLTITHIVLLNLTQLILTAEECKQNSEVALLLKYKILVGDTNNLERINLCREDLFRIDLNGLILWKANFKWAILQEGNFQKAFLVGADFEGANLQKADFTGALLKDANFDNSYLDYANLQEAKGLNAAQFDKAKLCATDLPKEINLNPDRNCGERNIQIYE